jgi:hypothetical protein
VHDQIERVITIMKLGNSTDEFRDKFARVFKKSALQMSFAGLDWNVGQAPGSQKQAQYANWATEAAASVASNSNPACQGCPRGGAVRKDSVVSA